MLRFPGASDGHTIDAEHPLPGVSHYSLGNAPSRWQVGIPQYGAVRYKDLYPGVDLLVTGRDGNLAFDAIVAPHVDPSIVKLRVEGAVEIRTDDDGDGPIVMRVGRRALQLRPPLVYQSTGRGREIVPSRYEIVGNTVAFRIGAYDRDRTLVIDPTLDYSTHLGGSDAFVTIFAADGGSLFYSTFLGGAANDIGRGVANAVGDMLYVSGQTSADDFSTTAGTFRASGCGSNLDAFVAVFDPDAAPGANLLYSTYLGAIPARTEASRSLRM